MTNTNLQKRLPVATASLASELLALLDQTNEDTAIILGPAGLFAAV